MNALTFGDALIALGDTARAVRRIRLGFPGSIRRSVETLF